MLFNSWVFAVFLPLVLVLYLRLGQRGQNIWLLLASYFFYGWWDARFCTLLMLSTVVDYKCGLAMEGAQSGGSRKRILFISLATNLGVLGFFKYFNFFTDSARHLLEQLGFEASIPTLNVLLPVGISFYTFQTLSYTIDVYRGRIKPINNFVDFGLYVAFFPQLVAGPIERATSLLPQIQSVRRVTWDHIRSGTFLVFIGLVKKIAIADSVAPVVNQIFAEPTAYTSLELLVGLYLFSFQIYGDFSGYSDIARGCARLMGFDLMVNFQQPYFSRNITEFWRRWHISLSSWLRDYLYIPLGGNRRGLTRTYINLMVTMLLGGLWHGASWSFVVWGGLHGAFLAIHKATTQSKNEVEHNIECSVGSLLKALPGIVLTFHLVALTWIFFRAHSFGSAWDFMMGILAFSDLSLPFGWKLLGVSLVLLLILDIPQYLSGKQTVLLDAPWPWRAAVYTLLTLAIFLLRTDAEIPFIYFQF